MNVIINAYAVSPDWGSEQGMGWNWIVCLARHCHLDIITEGEWRESIEKAVADMPQRHNMVFHYLPVSDKVRKMCWNQGDWRFYYHYEKWQRRALEKAIEIISHKKIDLIHQLNMIGFREPGYLWKIKDIPFVWGPVGGMELMPMAYLEGAPLKQRLFNILKNRINRFQYMHSPRVRAAIRRSSLLIAAVKGVQDVFSNIYHKESVLINETGVSPSSGIVKRKSEPGTPLNIIWVGKFDFRKQLPLALRAVAAARLSDFRFDICGSGPDETVAEMKKLADSLGIGSNCHWHGNVDHHKIPEMMADADLMLFTSIMEATSTVVLEAISVALPVLCFDTCGFGPVVRRFAGITTDISSPALSVSDLAAQLRRVDKDRSILNIISGRIVEERDSLTWEAKALHTSEMYLRIISGQNPICHN